MAKAKRAQDITQELVTKLVDQIEAGAGTWRMPWKALGEGGGAVNALTHKAYRGVNLLQFGMIGAELGCPGGPRTGQ